jgi:hypothetical protein
VSSRGDRERGDPPDQVLQDVQRGVVGPLQVLHRQQRRLPGPLQLRAQRGQDVVAVRAGAQRRRQLGADAADEIAERAEDPRGRQVVAVPDEHPGIPRHLGARRFHQPRLADPGLTGHQHDPAVAGRRIAHRRAQRGQLGLAFEDRPRHRPMFARRRRTLDASARSRGSSPGSAAGWVVPALI